MDPSKKIFMITGILLFDFELFIGVRGPKVLCSTQRIVVHYFRELPETDLSGNKLVLRRAILLAIHP
jgi:hypothetical protein